MIGSREAECLSMPIGRCRLRRPQSRPPLRQPRHQPWALPLRHNR